MTLFTGIWGSSKFGVASRTEEDLRSIHTCEEFLETHETRLHTAGRQRYLGSLNSIVYALTPFSEM